jgi:hypothetical protein
MVKKNNCGSVRNIKLLKSQKIMSENVEISQEKGVLQLTIDHL